MAMRLGKHVYCQKPLTHSVWEARLMRETAPSEKGVCTQMGNQGTANPGFRRGRRADPLGRDRRRSARSTSGPTGRSSTGSRPPTSSPGPRQTPGIPNHIHWDVFLGPAPERPYNPVYHPHDWRGWWDFGTGSLGDMACHTANLAFMALKLGPAHARLGRERRDQPRDLSRLGDDHLRVPRPRQPPARHAHLVRGGARTASATSPPPTSSPRDTSPSDSGSLFVGSKGKLYSPSDYGCGAASSGPSPRSRTSRIPSRRCRGSREARNEDDDHKKEWVEAIRAGKPTIALSNFDYASTLTESMLLGNVAVRSGESIDYDPATGRITNSSTASQYLKPYFRKGWEI